MTHTTEQTRSQKLMMHLKESITANVLGNYHTANVANNSIVKDISILNYETW